MFSAYKGKEGLLLLVIILASLLVSLFTSYFENILLSLAIFLGALLKITLPQWFEIIASIATAVTAFFSWQAIKQAEEISTKPVIGINTEIYDSNRKEMYLNINNISRDGDRWARNIKVTIRGTSFSEEYTRFLGPGEGKSFSFSAINKDDWKGKVLIISYFTFNGKKHITKYQFPLEQTEKDGEIGLRRIL